MARIDYRIMMSGLICLTIIYMTLILTNNNNETISTVIVGVIALAIGVVLPSPKIDNRRGVLVW